MKIVFVCRGNTCRSAMAHALAKQKLKLRPDILVCSAGTQAHDGMPASRAAIVAMAARGIELTSHRSTQLTIEIVRSADFLYTMTVERSSQIVRMFPEAEPKCQLLHPALPIEDPIGESPEFYAKLARTIDEGILLRLPAWL